MGLFSTQQQQDDENTPKLPPPRAERKLCWDKRDQFFKCLEVNNINDSLKELDSVKKNCSIEKQQFESSCVKSWITYFQEKRTNDLIRQKYIEKLESEGAKPLTFKLEPTTSDR